MKEILIRLEIVNEALTRVEAAWEKDAENKELEKEFDRLYNEVYDLRKELANAIVDFTKNKIDFNTAFSMTYNPKLADLIKSLA